MKNIANHILDITENSIRAKASKVEILLSLNTVNNRLKLSFVDDGIGMNEEMIGKVKDPFFSTRDTRRVGMGIPLLAQNSEMAGGQVTISSEEGEGTIVVATFDYDDIDCPPLGDIADTIYFLSASHTGIRFIFDYTHNDSKYSWDTDEINTTLDGLSIADHTVKDALIELLRSNIVLPN